MLALIKDQTFLGLVVEGARFTVPSVGTISPASLEWPGVDGWRLVPFTPASEPAHGFERVGAPTYTVTAEGVSESFSEQPIAVPAPTSVTRAQALIALYEAGLLAQVQSAVDAHPYYPIRIWWENALSFERSNAYLAAIAQELALAEDQIDALFLTASQRL